MDSFDHVSESNEEIRRHMLRGDYHQALDLLIRAYQHQIVAFCAYHLADNGPLAEETAQEVFLGAFQSMASFRGEASVRTWLYAIARNKCKNERWKVWKRNRLRKDREEEIRESSHREDRGDSPETVCVRETLRRLRVRDRELLLSLYLYGMSVGEVAKNFRVADRTIRRWSENAVLAFQNSFKRCIQRETST